MLSLGDMQLQSVLRSSNGIKIDEASVAAHLAGGGTVLKVSYPWAKDAPLGYYAFPGRLRDARAFGFEMVRGYKALPTVHEIVSGPEGLVSTEVVTTPMGPGVMGD